MPKVAARTSKSDRSGRLPSRKARPVFGDVSNAAGRQVQRNAKSTAETTARANAETDLLSRRRSARLLLGDKNVGETTAQNTNKTTTRRCATVTETRVTRSSSRSRGNNATNVESKRGLDTKQKVTQSGKTEEVSYGAFGKRGSKESTGIVATDKSEERTRCHKSCDNTSNQGGDSKPAVGSVSRGRPVQRRGRAGRTTRKASRVNQIEDEALDPRTETTRSRSRASLKREINQDEPIESEEAHAATRTGATSKKKASYDDRPPPSIRGHSKTRASFAAKATQNAANTFLQPTNTRTTRSKSTGNAKSNASKRRREEPAAKPRKKVRRSRSTATTSIQMKSEELEKPGRDSYPDFLAETDYNLVRVPFDSSKFTRGIAPVDEPDRDDPKMAVDYVTDIYQRLFYQEEISRPKLYMNEQPKLNATMRAILIDWLVEVHMKFRLLPETLYLCVNTIDRYLSVEVIERSKLQLVGVTALLVACKYEEIYPPEIRDCVYVTDRAYTRQEVLDTEFKIVDKLKYKMSVPTGHSFLRRFLYITKATDLQRTGANYYMERILQEYSFLKYRPSEIAAACVCLALNNPHIRSIEGIEGPPPRIPTELLEYTGFETSRILEVAGRICAKVGTTTVTMSKRELIAVKRKYEDVRYGHFSASFEDPDVFDLV